MSGTVEYLPTETAARLLGVSPGTLRSWRQRSLGPAYVRLPGGNARRGKYWEEKAGGTIVYPIDKLREFAEARLVETGRMPRPIPGRLPGGTNKPKAANKQRGENT